MPAGTLPKQGGARFSFHLKNRTLLDVKVALAEAFSVKGRAKFVGAM